MLTTYQRKGFKGQNDLFSWFETRVGDHVPMFEFIVGAELNVIVIWFVSITLKIKNQIFNITKRFNI